MMAMTNLVLVCGGVSPEHEISLRSVKNIFQAIDKQKYAVQLIGISKTGNWLLMDPTDLLVSIPEDGKLVSISPGKADCFSTDQGSLGNVDVIFPVLHGPNGEDGSIQGLLQTLDIPFVGSGILSSSISMDKDIAKRLLDHQGINVAEWQTIRRDEDLPSFVEVTKKLGDVVFVKPSNMGSSVGVGRVSNEEEWKSATKTAFFHDKKILVEKCLIGREMECAVIGNKSPKASGVGEVESGAVYSYDEKYADSSKANITIPANVSRSELDLLKETAIRSYKTLECEGLARVDMFLMDSGEIFVNEVNTMPGFTSISMYPKLWQEEGINYSALLDSLIELALEK